MIASAPFILQKRVPPGVVTSLHAEKNPTDQAVDLDHVAEALVGAYAHSEGGFFFSAWQFFQWLRNNPSDMSSMEASLLSHLVFGCLKTNGKTTTVLELQEISQDVSAEKMLRVLYEVNDKKCGKRIAAQI